MLLWIAMWGLLPPIAVGYYSYRQGKKGYDIAISSRDSAMKVLKDVGGQVAEMQKRLQALPDEKTLLDKIQKSVSGSYGRLIRSAKEAAEGEMDELAEDMMKQLTPEEMQAQMGQRFIAGVQNKVMGLLEKLS